MSVYHSKVTYIDSPGLLTKPTRCPLWVCWYPAFIIRGGYACTVSCSVSYCLAVCRVVLDHIGLGSKGSRYPSSHVLNSHVHPNVDVFPGGRFTDCSDGKMAHHVIRTLPILQIGSLFVLTKCRVTIIKPLISRCWRHERDRYLGGWITQFCEYRRVSSSLPLI